MYPCTESVLHQILHLIGRDNCRQALKLWTHHRREELQACDSCHYDEFGLEDHGCRPCLESKLRTFSLYQHDPEPFEKTLQEAVQKLQAFDRNAA